MLAPPSFGSGELLVCLCGVILASTKKATEYYISTAGVDMKWEGTDRRVASS